MQENPSFYIFTVKSNKHSPPKTEQTLGKACRALSLQNSPLFFIDLYLRNFENESPTFGKVLLSHRSETDTPRQQASAALWSPGRYSHHKMSGRNNVEGK